MPMFQQKTPIVSPVGPADTDRERVKRVDGNIHDVDLVDRDRIERI
jgi:hypothetical protein